MDFAVYRSLVKAHRVRNADLEEVIVGGSCLPEDTGRPLFGRRFLNNAVSAIVIRASVYRIMRALTPEGNSMNVRNSFLFLIFVSCFEVSFAAVTVGTCTSDQHPYATISSAVAAASPGEIVNVCPGTYAEQIEIGKPLTLQSVQGLATIVPPASGLNAIPEGSNTYPQVYINNSKGQVA